MKCDLTGRRFGRLTAIKIDHVGERRQTYWLCKCDCGNQKVVRSSHLLGGDTSSCGCYQKECMEHNPLKHGMTGTRLFKIWVQMRQRCENPNIAGYQRYGGRGIKVCNEWEDFNNFYNWSISNGYSATLTIDRRDNDKGYSPDNCRWTTRKQQCNNRRGNHVVEYCGMKKTVSEWAEYLGVECYILRSRLLRGWSIERAFNTPVRGEKGV